MVGYTYAYIVRHTTGPSVSTRHVQPGRPPVHEPRHHRSHRRGRHDLDDQTRKVIRDGSQRTHRRDVPASLVQRDDRERQRGRVHDRVAVDDAEEHPHHASLGEFSRRVGPAGD